MPPKLENSTAPIMRTGMGKPSLMTIIAPVAMAAAATKMSIWRFTPRSRSNPDETLPTVLTTMIMAPTAAAGANAHPALSTRMSGTKLVTAMYWPE